jgi:glycyl-tRNA synthetase
MKEDTKQPKEKTEKQLFEETMTKRFFYIPAYEIYGGVKGLYDYGPPGSAIMANVLQYWRQHFIIEENMLEISTTALTPEIVFQTSGHCGKFQDYMVKDVSDSQYCYRADHILKDKIKFLLEDKTLTSEKIKEMEHDLATLDDFSPDMLNSKIRFYKCVSPDTGNELSDPFPFNLMFTTQIGPTGKYLGFLRPETAQGMFVNFPRLLEYNNGKLPFAAAQIGPAFRNEIAPRTGLLRVREFTLAEIEHFVDPDDKSHHRFHEIKDYILPLLPRDVQAGDNVIVKMDIGTAVSKRIVNNETLGYFLVRVHQFLVNIGIKEENIRFRQHMLNEMAHYASDCWDAEIKCSYGWIECVGNADRACYDLTVHSKASGKTMSAFVNYKDGPREEEFLELKMDRALIGKSLKNKAKDLFVYLEENKDNQDELHCLLLGFQKNESVTIAGVQVTKEMVQINTIKKNVSGRRVRPSVIEPAFGIGRIIYCLLEQSFCQKPSLSEEGTIRTIISLKPSIAPVQCAIFPLVSNDDLEACVKRISTVLRKAKISQHIDTSGVSIGKRYARVDEIGCPFCVTVDYITLDDQCVTVRERDSTDQIRVPIELLVQILNTLIQGDVTWSHYKSIYPITKVTN